VRSLLELLFPSICALCQNPARDLCQRCGALITSSRLRIKISGIEFSAGAIYGEAFSRLVLLAKEENYLSARNVLVQYLVDAYMQSAQRLQPGNLVLLPIPSSRAANRKRGYRHSLLLATGLRDALQRKTNRSVEVSELLVVNRKIQDQSTLNRGERAENLHGAYSINSKELSARSENWLGQSILVDDLLTTGSSMGEAIRCLKAAGITPSGALSAGVSPHLIS